MPEYLDTAHKKLEAAIVAWIEANLTATGKRLEGWTVYAGASSGVRNAPKHILVEVSPGGGPLARFEMFDVEVALIAHRHAKKQQESDPEPALECGNAVEELAAAFRYERNAAMKAALEALDPDLQVTGYWPEPRRDQGTSDAFELVVPLAYHVCVNPYLFAYSAGDSLAELGATFSRDSTATFLGEV